MKRFYAFLILLTIILTGRAQNPERKIIYCKPAKVNDYSYEDYRLDFNNYAPEVFYSLEAAYLDPQKVKILDLSGQGLSSLSYRIGELKNLEVLVLRDNDLEELPFQIFSLPNLKILDVSNNRLTELRYQIGQLKNLKILILKNNEISELPYQISFLHSLQLLDASYNQIEEIPYQISYLKNLEKLYLDHNRIKNLPYQLSYLPRLKLLDIRHNFIEEIPYQIRQKTSE